MKKTTKKNPPHTGDHRDATGCNNIKPKRPGFIVICPQLLTQRKEWRRWFAQWQGRTWIWWRYSQMREFHPLWSFRHTFGENKSPSLLFQFQHESLKHASLPILGRLGNRTQRLDGSSQCGLPLDDFMDWGHFAFFLNEQKQVNVCAETVNTACQAQVEVLRGSELRGNIVREQFVSTCCRYASWHCFDSESVPHIEACTQRPHGIFKHDIKRMLLSDPQ